MFPQVFRPGYDSYDMFTVRSITGLTTATSEALITTGGAHDDGLGQAVGGRPLRANDDETNAPLEFTLEG